MNPDTPTPKPPKAPAPRITRNIPKAAKAISEVLDLVVDEWEQRPQLTLEWKTQPQAKTLAKDLRESLRDTSTAQDAIGPNTLRLQQLDDVIDGPKDKAKLKYVRKALALQYDEENDGRAYYGEFGIVKVGSTYTLPRDRAERAEALNKLVKALTAHGLADSKYGVKFWQPIATDYNDLQPKAAKATGDRATEVVDKDGFVEQARAFLVAFLLLLEANYPKTYKAERRNFGFLKESY
ncbi:MAG: hypothetical protein JWP58_2377 [Hymenobacter sp.]|nr:hypothetical protein [Hymenobacter sp.]